MYKQICYVLCILSIQGCMQQGFEVSMFKDDVEKPSYRGFAVEPVPISSPSSTQKTEKKDFLAFLATQIDQNLKPIQISVREGEKVYKNGEVLNFKIEPGEKSLQALTLFNVSSKGALQFLYPFSQDPILIKKFPYILGMRISPPYGEEHLVVVFCRDAATGLHRLLKSMQPALPNNEQIMNQLRQNKCQFGQYTFLTEK